MAERTLNIPRSWLMLAELKGRFGAEFAFTSRGCPVAPEEESPAISDRARLQSQYIRETEAPIDVIWSSDFQRSTFRASDQTFPRRIFSALRPTHEGTLDRANVNKHVRPTIVRLNKAVAFLAVEPLHNTRCHFPSPMLAMRCRFASYDRIAS